MSNVTSSPRVGVELACKTDSPPPRQHAAASDDDSASSSSSYEYESSNDLNMWQGAALLTADCLGTGLLALPQDVAVLGRAVGLAFLVSQLPINLYAGTILARAAETVEEDQQNNVPTGDGLVCVSKKRAYKSVSSDVEATTTEDQSDEDEAAVNHVGRTTYSSIASDTNNNNHDNAITLEDTEHHHHHHDSATLDFISMTQQVFHGRTATRLVMGVYYTNIFLVLGDYILVMSHAVAAIVDDQLCLPLAGVLASTLMFGISQLRTMANLGRTASIVSLMALAIVIAQCLIGIQQGEKNRNQIPPTPTMLGRLSSLASIGFAVGSQKLFLNIRHEMKHRTESPKSLGISLTVFGSFYVLICLLAGPNPPPLLFDAIRDGWNRRVAGLLLWIHVAVSYAINSQAICSSMDRLFLHGLIFGDSPKKRWLVLTLGMAVSSYLVANAVPFFKDLLALIGALTSVPLTLLLPAIIHRRVRNMSLWWPTRKSMASFSLLVFGMLFLITGLAGALGSIEFDWSKHGPPFSCH